MGTITVLFIGDEPLRQLRAFSEPHDLNGGVSWSHWVCTIDRLQLKPGATGRTLDGSDRDRRGETDFVEIPSGLAGQARKDAIDFEAMRDAAAAEAMRQWDAAAAARGDLRWTTFHELCLQSPGDRSVHDRYGAQSAVCAMHDAGFGRMTLHSIDWFALPRDDYVQDARASVLADAYFQVVHDGKPLVDNSEDAYERDMNEAPQPVSEYLARRNAWFARFKVILDASPAHTLLTSVLVKA